MARTKYVATFTRCQVNRCLIRRGLRSFEIYQAEPDGHVTQVKASYCPKHVKDLEALIEATYRVRKMTLVASQRAGRQDHYQAHTLEEIEEAKQRTAKTTRIS